MIVMKKFIISKMYLKLTGQQVLSELNRTQIELIIDIYLDLVADVLREGNGLRLGHIGTIKTVVRRGRKYRTPTGLTVSTSDRRVVRFTSSSRFAREICTSK